MVDTDVVEKPKKKGSHSRVSKNPVKSLTKYLEKRHEELGEEAFHEAIMSMDLKTVKLLYDASNYTLMTKADERKQAIALEAKLLGMRVVPLNQ